MTAMTASAAVMVTHFGTLAMVLEGEGADHSIGPFPLCLLDYRCRNRKDWALAVCSVPSRLGMK